MYGMLNCTSTTSVDKFQYVRLYAYETVARLTVIICVGSKQTALFFEQRYDSSALRYNKANFADQCR